MSIRFAANRRTAIARRLEGIGGGPAVGHNIEFAFVAALGPLAHQDIATDEEATILVPYGNHLFEVVRGHSSYPKLSGPAATAGNLAPTLSPHSLPILAGRFASSNQHAWIVRRFSLARLAVNRRYLLLSTVVAKLEKIGPCFPRHWIRKGHVQVVPDSGRRASLRRLPLCGAECAACKPG